MNFLFYMGIIVPTAITMALFMIFIYCWFLQKARKEVLTKKYDPHGRMRQLGLTMWPPEPPLFCLVGEEGSRSEAGEDNIAYDVSRSPSTQQEGPGCSLYQTYQEATPLTAGVPSLHRQAAPGGLSICPEPPSLHPPPPPPHRVSVRLKNVHPRPTLKEMENCPVQIHQAYGDQEQPPRLKLQQQHPTNVPSYGSPSMGPPSLHDDSHLERRKQGNQYSPIRDITTPGNSQLVSVVGHWNLSSTGSSLLSPQRTTSPATASINQGSIQAPRWLTHPASQVSEGSSCLLLQATSISQSRDRFLPLSAINASALNHVQEIISGHQNFIPNENLTLSPTSTEASRNSYRDSGISDTGQSLYTGSDRPDSQASLSSTTDSEDSGFRGSYSTTDHKTVLSRQGNPLLKPRKIRHSKGNRKSSKRPDSRLTNHDCSVITLNPLNLHNSSPTSESVSKTLSSTSETTKSCFGKDIRSGLMSTSTTGTSGTPSYPEYDSPAHSRQESPSYEVWPTTLSTTDQQPVGRPSSDLSDHNSHLGWTHLNSRPQPCDRPDPGVVMETYHRSAKPGHTGLNKEQSIEMFGFSIV